MSKNYIRQNTPTAQVKMSNVGIFSRTFVATSNDGLNFTPLPEICSPHFYLRLFKHADSGVFYGISKPPFLHRKLQTGNLHEFDVDENRRMLNNKTRHLAFLYRYKRYKYND